MSESKFKTMRHIETVRNYLNAVIKEFIVRGEKHDQTKLESPEVEIFEVYTSKLRDCTYGSDEYKQNMKEMQVAIKHHNTHNRHHPEFHIYNECNGCFKRFDSLPDYCDVCKYSQFTVRHSVSRMNLIDIMEMLCDWKAATMRHADGDIYKSLEINQKRFGYGDELKTIMFNTIEYIENNMDVSHKANES